jgi:hypothetical protein
MVTRVIVFEELNRVVSPSPTKERMKAFSLARQLDPYQAFKSLIGSIPGPLSRAGVRETDSGDWRCEQTWGNTLTAARTTNFWPRRERPHPVLKQAGSLQSFPLR